MPTNRDAFRRAIEEAARLHESIDTASDYERVRRLPGAGAMGAVIEYRDAIRAISNPFPEEAEPQESALRKALREIAACPWDCAAPGRSCHDIARRALSPAQDSTCPNCGRDKYADQIRNSEPGCPACCAPAQDETEEKKLHDFEPCELGDSGSPDHNFTCALLCIVCGLPAERHRAPEPAGEEKP